MNKILIGALISLAAFSAQAQTLIFEEDFSGGDADWLDSSYGSVTHNASGGHDGGAYISETVNINTSGGGNFGGYLVMGCADAPSQAPSQNCSGGNFVGDYYLTQGIQELSFWVRHDSSHSGGLQIILRVATPNNQLGGSIITAPIAANTWTQVTAPIDLQDPLWDKQWGAIAPDAVKIFRNIGRLQPGYYFDPNDPTYTENGVTFDIDDVSISGSTLISATVNVESTLHPHHDGAANAIAGLNDPFDVAIFGAANLDTDDIVNSSLRVGQLGGIPTGVAKNQAVDADGYDDAVATTLTGVGGAGIGAGLADRYDDCVEPGKEWWIPDDIAVRGELSTGEVIAGLDSSLQYACNAQCH